MAVKITPKQLRAFGLKLDEAKAELLIEGAVATAYLVAPCLEHVEPDSVKALAARAIIIGAIARWASGNTEGVQNQSALGFSVAYTPASGKFSAAEKQELREICSPNRGKAFSIDTMPQDAAWWGADDQSLDDTYDAGLDDELDTQAVECGGCWL
jgi:tellurite resistance protein